MSTGGAATTWNITVIMVEEEKFLQGLLQAIKCPILEVMKITFDKIHHL